MRVKVQIIFIFLVLAAGLFCSLFALSNVKPFQIDIVGVNDIVQNTEQAVRIKSLIEKDGYMFIKSQAVYGLYIIIVCSFGFLFITLIAYLLYLRRIIIKPFAQLKRFASNVASGNLDYEIHMDKNNVFGAFTESFDIMRTELKKARENENLANKAKKELIASLSHDIKTPVASIKAISELLLAITSDDKVKAKVSTIYDKTEQIDHLVTDMFNATLEELGELSVNVKEEYSTILEGLITNADYLEKASIAEIPQCMIKTDIQRLGQVIDNVFANAYKYAGTRIDIRFVLTQTHLEMDIHDYGKGVGDDELPLILGKFYRGKNVEAQSGSGLGLYISKYFMQKQDGEILCYNTSDGFTVKVMIKLA